MNKAAKVVIYCYEDGSRGRDALRHILGDSQLKALQSDGYNVYIYLDDELIDTDHLCCLAHARAKFKYALDQGGDKDAAFFLDAFGELYQLEAAYETGKLSAEQIKACRENLKTKEIIIKIRSKLDAMLSYVHPPRGELIDKALSYLNTFLDSTLCLHQRWLLYDHNSIAEDSYAHCPVSVKIPYSLAVVRWREYLQPTIRLYSLARCRVFLHCNTLKCFSRRSLTDVGIMRIFFK